MAALGELRDLMSARLSRRAQIPEVVGDRRLLRFIRGHNFNMDKIVQKFTSFLDFRDANRVDDIRNEILYKSMSPFEFPNGKKIINLVPQIVLAHDALDNLGNPMSLEEFGFNPELVMKSVSKEEFLRFVIFTLEYRVLVLEQLSDLKEKAYLAQYPENTPPPDSPPYGVILQCCTIRDFGKFGLDNVSSDGRQILSWILGIAMDNYPELLYRSHFVRVPWVFNTLWAFVKGMIDPNTLKKVTMNGNDYMGKLLEDLPLTSIPKRLGGTYEGYNTAFAFDVTEAGPFHYAGRPFFSAHESTVMSVDVMTQARAFLEKHSAPAGAPTSAVDASAAAAGKGGNGSSGGHRLASVGGVTVVPSTGAAAWRGRSLAGAGARGGSGGAPGSSSSVAGGRRPEGQVESPGGVGETIAAEPRPGTAEARSKRNSPAAPPSTQPADREDANPCPPNQKTCSLQDLFVWS